MTALWLSRSWNIHLMSSVTLLRLNMHFFLSCISSQGSTLSCLAAVLYLFHIFHMVSSSFLLQSQHCAVFRVRLYVLLSHNSLSKYLAKGTGSPHSFFSICTESENNLQTKTWNWWAANSTGAQRVQANSSPRICGCRLHGKRIRKENTSCKSLSLVLSYTFSCPSNCS